MRDMAQDAMPVAAWEFYALAVMLVASHGDEAEAEAARRFEAAEAANDRGQMVVWTEVTGRLDTVRSDRRARQG
jgi:hypothetical protein